MPFAVIRNGKLDPRLYKRVQTRQSDLTPEEIRMNSAITITSIKEIVMTDLDGEVWVVQATEETPAEVQLIQMEDESELRDFFEVLEAWHIINTTLDEILGPVTNTGGDTEVKTGDNDGGYDDMNELLSGGHMR